MAEAQTAAQAPTDTLSQQLPECAPPLDSSGGIPLRGNVIHYTRTRNRFKIVPEGKMPHEAVYLPLMKMNSRSDGGRAVDDQVMASKCG